MNKLWKKESNEIDGNYVDLLGVGTRGEHFIDRMLEHMNIAIQKNDTASSIQRAQGNEFFGQKNWRIAMEFYSASLRFATNVSENIGLAYANRSATFFHMGLYDQCLIDIGLARKANYPQRLMSKLNEREAACIQKMAESTKFQKARAKPALSFEADDKYASMANVLKIQQNDEFGKHLVATDEIAVGETIVLEDVFCVGVFADDRAYCSTCLKFIRNFIPCPNCSYVMFCDAACMESNDTHKIDCGAMYYTSLDSAEIALVKSILLAISAFSSVADLMAFVERCLISRDDDELMTGPFSMAQLKYGQFLKLLAEPKDVDSATLNSASAYQYLLKIPAIRQRFDTMQKQRFLAHLIWQHFLIKQTNSWSYELQATKCYVNATAHLPSLFNHSCFPNVFVGMHGMQQMAITIRPVKKGEQLFIQYRMNAQDDGEKFKFVCKCSKCQPCHNVDDSVRMLMDPKFRYILNSKEWELLDDQKFATIKSTCIEFLTEYGHLPWSKEIECIWMKYTYCLDHEYFRF